MARTKKNAQRSGQLRIIGGQWRGRKLSFTAAQGLRPTTDRIRETVFNWLAPYVTGANCLDLFAGSGALGLEALSRGAARCDFIDTSPIATHQIRDHLVTLRADDRGLTYCLPADHYLGSYSGTYNIVFIDPPFHQDLVEPVCWLLEDRLGPCSPMLVYVETAVSDDDFALPSRWRLHRDKAAGDVRYRLFMVG